MVETKIVAKDDVQTFTTVHAMRIVKLRISRPFNYRPKHAR